MSNFAPSNWYWRDDAGRIYSSSRQQIVAADDAEFLAFAEANGFVTRWPVDEAGAQTDAALADVLAPYGLALWPLSLDAIKTSLKAEIDAAAEIERLRYITPGAGQAMTYQAKVEEARAVTAAQSPEPTDYPLLNSEVGITAPTLVGVAAVVLAMYQQWLVIGGAIEAVRLGAKAAIDAAGSEQAANDVVAAVMWPQPAA